MAESDAKQPLKDSTWAVVFFLFSFGKSERPFTYQANENRKTLTYFFRAG